MYEESELPDDDYGFVTDYLEEQEIAVKDDCIFYMYLPEREAFRQRVKYEFPAVAISLSDYNHLLTMRGYEPVALDEDEFGLQWQSIATEESRKEFLSENRQTDTDAGTLTLSESSIYDFELGETLYNNYTDVVYIFPDIVCEKLLAVDRNRYIMTEESVPFEKAVELEQIFGEVSS